MHLENITSENWKNLLAKYFSYFVLLKLRLLFCIFRILAQFLGRSLVQTPPGGDKSLSRDGIFEEIRFLIDHKPLFSFLNFDKIFKNFIFRSNFENHRNPREVCFYNSLWKHLANLRLLILHIFRHKTWLILTISNGTHWWPWPAAGFWGATAEIKIWKSHPLPKVGDFGKSETNFIFPSCHT